MKKIVIARKQLFSMISSPFWLIGFPRILLGEEGAE